jgi:predicted double-glycine peptidase
MREDAMRRIVVHGFVCVAVLLGCGIDHSAAQLRALTQPGSPIVDSGDYARPIRCRISILVGPRQHAVCANNYHEYQSSAIKIALPEVQQPDEYSCGVASLMAILAYYGTGPENYDDLKKLIGATEKSGTDYHRIARFARGQGLEADTVSAMSLPQLETCLSEGKPVICAIQAYAENIPSIQRAEVYRKNDNGHYLVAVGFDDNNIYFMDPSLTGRRGFLPKAEFVARWHDNEGTSEQPKPICHLGLVIYKQAGASIYARFARRVD